MHVYLAGPMRGYAEFNFPAFRKQAAFLRALGYTVTSPAEMDEELDFDPTGTLEAQEFSVTDAMRRDFQVIIDADGVVLMEGWEQSTGARAERFVAEQTGKVVRYLKPCGGSWSVIDAPEWDGDPRKPRDQIVGWFESRDVDDLAGAIKAIEDEGYLVIDMNAPVQAQADKDFLARNESFNLEQQRALSDTQRERAAVARYMENQPGSFVKAAQVLDPDRVNDARQDGIEEVRVVDPATGGEKGTKLARYDLIPADVLEELAEHYGRGARKYADRNWEKGYAWSLSYAALMRHLQAFWQQEDIDHDPVIGDSPHIIAVVWHAMALAAFSFRHDGTDDRP